MKSAKDTCNYEEVNVNENENCTDLINHGPQLLLRNVLRQILICSTIWTLYFITGLHVGSTTVIISQMRKEQNSTTVIDDELASWMTSMLPIGAFPWTFILPTLVHKIGRRRLFIFICFSGFLGTIIVYLSYNVRQFLIGEFIFGIVLGSNHTISPVIVTEYSSPKYRGIFLTIKSASIFWGIWSANTIGMFWHWRNIFIVAFLCNAYTLTVFAWPESPYWLAKENRFIDCAKIHRELKGKSKEAEENLDHIIKQYQDDSNDRDLRPSKNWYQSWLETLSCKAFYKPLYLAILLGIQYNLMGKMICSLYAVQILKKITGNEPAAYKGMLVLDGVTVFSAYCGCVVSRYCKRRTMLFSSSSMTIIFLYIFSLYLFLTRNLIINENNYVSISLLSIFSVTVCSGPMILLSSIYGELVSIKYQRSSTIVYGAVLTLVTIVSLKISLQLFKALTLPGAFLFFAISSTIATFILYLYLPETKNKSVEEIEKHFTDTKKTRTEITSFKPDL